MALRGAATVAGSILFAVPAFAEQNYYNTNPTTSERAATEALNAASAARVHEDADSDRDPNRAYHNAYDPGRPGYDREFYRDGRRYGAYYDRQGPVAASLDFGNVAIAYQDGYWDSGRLWHRWSSNAEARAYRARYRSHYHGWNHDRDGTDGWPAY